MPQKIAVCHPYRDGESDTDKKSPQLRLTVQEVIDRRQSMRCDWYLEAILGAMKKIGYSFRINSIPAFCEKIGLSIRTFQRARRFLINSGKLIETRINRDCIEFFLSSNDDKPIAQDDKPIAQDDKPIAQDDKPIAQDDKPIAVIPLEAAQCNGSEFPPTLLTTPFTTPLSSHEGERDFKKPIPKSEEITPDYWTWLEAQALKMPRAIGNIPVWIRVTAKKWEWRETYADYVAQKAKCSALSPSTDEYFRAVEPLSDAEISEAKAAILKARQSLKISAPAPSKYDRLPSISSFESLGLGSI